MDIEVRAEVAADSAEVHAVIAAAFDDETVAVLWEDLAVRPQAASFVAVNDRAAGCSTRSNREFMLPAFAT
jgi:hypothetical protein